MRVLRRTLLAIVGVQVVLALTMSLVDSYRRRGKKPKPFPTTPPRTVAVGGGTVTTYTYGKDLYADMLAAIEGAERQILFETYIWKGDAVGERFKIALSAAADRGVDVYCIYDGFANLVVSPVFKHFPANMKVMRYPVYAAGWRFFDLTRYGRDHRKILVVDDAEGFVGGYNIGSRVRDRVARHPRADHRPWGLGPQARLRRLLEPQPPAAAAPQRAPAAAGDRLHLGAADPLPPQRAGAVDVPDPRRCTSRRSTAPATRIWMTQAYFIPDQDFVDAMKAAARRGVDVRLLMPLKSNHIVADWISRGYFSQLLEAGRADLPLPRRDGARQDRHRRRHLVHRRHRQRRPAQPQGNYEINVEVIDPELARTLEEIFAVDESNCLELTRGEWEARDLHRKFTEFVLAPLRPLL